MKTLLTSVLAFSLLFGCGGEENPLTPDGGDLPDAGPPPPPPPPPQIVTVSGQIYKLGAYLAGTNEYAGGVSVLALGVAPLQSTTSAEDGTVGAYSLTIPANGQVDFFSSKLGYFPTYTPVTVQQANVANQKLYVVENAWLNAIATAHNVNLNASFACHAPGLDPAYQCVYGVVIGRVLDDGTAGNGTLRPVEGVSADDFTITGGVNGADWYVKGPYFLNYDGTANAANQTSVVLEEGGEYKGGLYVTFVEIPQTNGPEAINVQLKVTYADAVAGLTRQFGPQSVQVYRSYGVTWSNVNETGLAPPPPLGDVDFDSQIYPLLLPVNQGGYGCQGCHTNQGGATPAGGMNLYGGPEAAYASLDPNEYPQRVNLGSPAASYLLTKPLYEAAGPQDHPIYAFASTQDPAYQLISKWINEGGQRGVVVTPVSFSNQVRPLLYLSAAEGGAGCYACHVSGVNADNAPGGFYMGGTPEELHAELVTEAAVDNGDSGEGYRINKNGTTEASLVLTNPLYGNPEPHPVKIFSSNVDPRYQLIYRWIQEGYQLD